MPAAARRVLVVEDDPVIQLLVSEVLRGESYDVWTADDGAEGLALVQEDPPELVVLDVMMPNLNGYEVLEQMRREPPSAEIPVILLTALNSDEDVARGFAAGANDFIKKPFQTEDLLARVKALLA